MADNQIKTSVNAGNKTITTSMIKDVESTIVNDWKPDLNSRWADPDYKNTEWYRRSTAAKRARIYAKKDYEKYQEQVQQIAEANKGRGVGAYVEELTGEIKNQAAADVDQDDAMEE